MTTTVEKSIQVEAPISVVYNQWTQFEEFPSFMGGVQKVEQLDATRLHWVAEIAGVRREWDAEVLQQVPDELVSWAATGGATNAGQVTFRPAGPDATEVTLHLEYEPEGIVEAVGDKLHIVEKQASSDLEKFKTFIEERGVATGGWRGAVNETAAVGRVGVDAAADSRGDSGKAGVSPKTVAAGVAAVAAAAAVGVSAKRSGQSDEVEVESDVVVRPATETTSTSVPTSVPATPVAPADDLDVASADAAGAGFAGAGLAGAPADPLTTGLSGTPVIEDEQARRL